MVKDVNPHEFVKAYSALLKRSGKARKDLVHYWCILLRQKVMLIFWISFLFGKAQVMNWNGTINWSIQICFLVGMQLQKYIDIYLIASHLVNELQAQLLEERRLREEMEARAVEEREAQRQRIEELVGFVSTLGAAMGRTMPASLVLPLPQAATPHQSGVASNQIGGSPASQIGASPAPQLEPNQVEGSPGASNHGPLHP
ncbi:uncharacterized protein [Miscanthus floridulus]|uniref:uncharacterized protein n=1 Tax=Miscanthus floridulus TaxID=154761 RepID=UPI00345B468E